jgi:hypothetical protein
MAVATLIKVFLGRVLAIKISVVRVCNTNVKIEAPADPGQQFRQLFRHAASDANIVFEEVAGRVEIFDFGRSQLPSHAAILTLNPP